MPRLLDLFCGRCGIAKVFAERGWDCVAVDLVEPSNIEELPRNIEFYQADVLGISHWWIQQRNFDFAWASSPCEQFSVHGMKHFHPNPPHPELGLKLFNHTKQILELSGLPYVMENVRSAQQFVGKAVHHCRPFYLWGNAVPLLMPQGLQKGTTKIQGCLNRRERLLPPAEKYALRMRKFSDDGLSYTMSKNKRAALTATIPNLLAHAIAEYAERLLEQKAAS